MEEFKCSKCGACCRNVLYAEETSFLAKENGVCKYLNEDTNECTIYDIRPNICRVEKMYKRYKNKMSYEDYLKMNYDACKELQELEKSKHKEEVEELDIS